jgi:hypothetical protein
LFWRFLFCQIYYNEIGQEQKERHQQGEADAELERLRQEVKRKALGLRGIIGLTPDDLAVWRVKQEAKKKQ